MAARPPDRRRFAALTLASTLICLSAGTLLAADSPNGDQAAAWPTSWRSYTLANSSLVSDVIGDVGCGQGYCDVSSGPSGNLSSVYFASDGTNVFFRIRLLGDPRKASAGGFQSTTYALQIAVNGTSRVTVGLDGKNPHRDFVYVANADGTAHTEVYATPFDGSGGQSSAGARGLPDGSGQFFVDWQVPLSRITQRSGGAITGSTPVQLFFGTSQSANLAVLNKDFMIGNGVSFGSGSTVTLVPQAPVAPAVVPPAAPAPVQPGAPAPPPAAPGAPGPGTSGTPALPNTNAPAGPTLLDLGLAALLVAGGFLVLNRPRRVPPSS